MWGCFISFVENLSVSSDSVRVTLATDTLCKNEAPKCGKGLSGRKATLLSGSDTVLYPNQSHIYVQTWKLRGFPGGAVVQNPPANAGDARDAGLIPGLGRSPAPASLPGGSHGHRSLAGYSPQGRKESDMTERLCTNYTDGKERKSLPKKSLLSKILGICSLKVERSFCTDAPCLLQVNTSPCWSITHTSTLQTLTNENYT